MEEVIDLIDVEGHKTDVMRQQDNYSSFRSELESAVQFLLPKKKLLAFECRNVTESQSAPVPDNGPGKIWFATGNYGKVKEFRGFIENSGHLSELLDGVLEFDVPGGPLPDVDETGTTLYENSILKSAQTGNELGVAIMAEDSGVCVPLLGGEPGVYSARYFDRNFERYPEGTFGDAGIVLDEIMSDVGRPLKERKKDASDFMNKVMLLHRISEKGGIAGSPIPAYHQTVATISNRRGKVLASGIGTLFGEIVPPSGSLGDLDVLRSLHRDFGYNSVFFMRDDNGKPLCLSDVSISERLKWNHRSIAMTRAIIDLLIKLA